MSIPITAPIEAAFKGRIGAFEVDIAFTAPLNGVTALFGPSGSGKTTVLRCIAGLSRLSGRLSVGGVEWQSERRFLPPHRRPIGYVFQGANLFPHLSVSDNLKFGEKRAHKRGGGADVDFGEIVSLLGLNALLHRMPGGLSGGERQRVAVGRALLSAPQLLLMDEPLSGLDQAAKADILPYFEKLTEQLAVPILYVSHDIGEVARLADRIVQISEGRALASGPVSDMLERLDLGALVDPFEESVLVAAEVVGHDPTYRLTRLTCCGQPLTIPETDLGIGDAIRLRIRARDVALATQRPQGISIRNIFQGRITEIVIAPGQAHAETLVDIGGARLRARITLEALADLELAVGKPVFALVKSAAFDGRSVRARVEHAPQ